MDTELYELGGKMLIKFSRPHTGEPVKVWLAVPVNEKEPGKYYLRYRFGPSGVFSNWRLVGLEQMSKKDETQKK